MFLCSHPVLVVTVQFLRITSHLYMSHCESYISYNLSSFGHSIIRLYDNPIYI